MKFVDKDGVEYVRLRSQLLRIDGGWGRGRGGGKMKMYALMNIKFNLSRNHI